MRSGASANARASACVVSAAIRWTKLIQYFQISFFLVFVLNVVDVVTFVSYKITFYIPGWLLKIFKFPILVRSSRIVKCIYIIRYTYMWKYCEHYCCCYINLTNRDKLAEIQIFIILNSQTWTDSLPILLFMYSTQSLVPTFLNRYKILDTFTWLCYVFVWYGILYCISCLHWLSLKQHKIRTCRDIRWDTYCWRAAWRHPIYLRFGRFYTNLFNRSLCHVFRIWLQAVD